MSRETEIMMFTQHPTKPSTMVCQICGKEIKTTGLMGGGPVGQHRKKHEREQARAEGRDPNAVQYVVRSKEVV